MSKTKMLLLIIIAMVSLEAQAQKSNWADLKKYIGSYSKETDFFENTIIKKELKRILGTDYKDYHDFVSLAGCGEIEFKNGLIYGDVSQDHVGGYSSLFFIDTKGKKMFLFWLKETVGDKKYKIYGDKPIYPSVLNLIAEEMNISWGHVAKFKVQGDSIAIDLNKR